MEEKKLTGYESLKEAVMRDCKEGQGCFNENGCNHQSECFHKYCDTFKWAIDRAKHYGEKLGLNWEDVLSSWEDDRNYWYMNYYQEANQPEIKGDKVRVFDTVEDLLKSVGERKFRCPSCGGISTDPYECNSGKEMSKGKKCDWKVYGLFGDLGKGTYIYCKDKLKGQTIFTPIAWETEEEKLLAELKEGEMTSKQFLGKLKEKGISIEDIGWNSKDRKIGYAKTKGVGDGYNITFYYFHLDENNVLIKCPRGFTKLRGMKIVDMDSLIKSLNENKEDK